MVMDSGLQGLAGLADGFQFGDHFPSPDYRLDRFARAVNGDFGAYARNRIFDPLDPPVAPSDAPGNQISLGYINSFLMEEEEDDVHERVAGDPALMAAEKPFLEILGGARPIYPEGPPERPRPVRDAPSSGENGLASAFDGRWLSDFVCELHCMPELRPLCMHYAPQPPFATSCDGNAEVPVVGEDSPAESFDGSSGHLLECQFRKGVEEARRFLPAANELVIDLESAEFLPPADASVNSPGPRGRKNRHEEDPGSEDGRSTKQSAVGVEETIRSSMFDEVLLCKCGKKKKNAVEMLMEALQHQLKSSRGPAPPRGPAGRSRGRKQSASKEVVDLRTLLIHCAQYVATDDRRSASELLRQIRQHSSPSGDGTQRLAQVFADGLEARLAGTGSDRYHSFLSKRQSATDILKAYHLFTAACPFKRISHFFANQTILNVAEGAARLHIIDFGINFGFQWPCLIHRLSMRPGGPPALRITGIDTPQPGFRPTERLEETGCRLADYCRSFGVEFEYRQIARSWEEIGIEDLGLREDETLVVNCMYQFRHLADETFAVDSPRSIVLKNIRRMKPEIFIHGVVNGSFSAPFFVTRFREALFHYSSLFDILDTTVPRGQAERLLIETEIFGREAMNVIACEGSERIERPETYKQWQARNMKAGFRQLPLNGGIMGKCRERVRSSYHRDFLFDEDGGWLLQGWKGRIVYAMSTWRPESKDL